MPGRASRLAALAALLLCAGEARAQLETDAAGWRLRLELSNRARWEDANWFEPASGNQPDYAFFGNRTKLGLRATRGSHELFVQYQHSWLASLPEGTLGPGGSYFLNNQERYDHQGIWRVAWLKGRFAVGTGLVSAQIGRQIFREGLESPLAEPTLAWLQEQRMAERLIGPFEYTHVGRSFDGVWLQFNRERLDVSAYGFIPTAGGFELDANRELHVAVGGGSVTAKDFESFPGTSARVFGIFYRDRRDVVMLDNGPPGDGPLEIYSLGANLLGAARLGPGKLDFLAWGVLQFGDWQEDSHEAYAYALELGYRLTEVFAKPWLRVGWNASSGDSDPLDDEHETFFQILPTARLYAQFPFYNLMNNQDLFAQLVLEPLGGVTATASVHQLRVAEGNDLMYGGGGATSNNVFGYSGVSGAGAESIGTLVDLTLTWKPAGWLTLSGYYGHVSGHGVLARAFADEDADYGFVEATLAF